MAAQTTPILPRMSTGPMNLQPPPKILSSQMPSNIQSQQLPFVNTPPASTKNHSADNKNSPSTHETRSKTSNRQGIKQSSSVSSSASTSMGKSGPICWNCGEVGHRRRGCQNPPYCSKCKQKGHLPVKCPLKGKRNETSQMPQKVQQTSVDQRFSSIRNKCIHCGGDHAPGSCPMKTQPQATPNTASYQMYNNSAVAADVPGLRRVDLQDAEITPGMRSTFDTLCEKYPKVFSKGNEDIGRTQLVTMDIDMGDSPPVSSRPYTLAFKHHSDMEEEHLAHIKEIFRRLEAADLKMKRSKCDFFKKHIHYLGHLISADGIQPLKDKLDMIRDMPAPRNSKEVKQFLSLTGYYRKFVPHFADLSRPLARLTCKDRIFEWTHECRKAFNFLKQSLCAQPVLKYADTSKGYTLYTDVSKYEWAGVLTQAHTSMVEVFAEKHLEQQSQQLGHGTGSFQHQV